MGLRCVDLDHRLAARMAVDELAEAGHDRLVFIGYPAGTPTHNPRNVHIEIKLVAIENGKVAQTQKTLIQATGGQGTMNVNSWAPDSMRFAYVTYEPLP